MFHFIFERGSHIFAQSAWTTTLLFPLLT
jgi:hypothetical protein